jgi:hypothetical protein
MAVWLTGRPAFSQAVATAVVFDVVVVVGVSPDVNCLDHLLQVTVVAGVRRR